MPDPATRLRAFVLSPGDTTPERDLLDGVVAELNRGVGAEHGIVLDLFRWETHVRPGIGSDAQAVINRQLPSLDVFIAIFWTRLGTPTPRADSGSAEEFHRAVTAWKEDPNIEVLTYFKTAAIPYRSVDPAQLQALMEFKSTIRSTGVLAMEFEDTADLEAKVREHLAGVVRTWADRLSPPPPRDPPVGAAITTEPLPDITLDVPGTPAELRTPERDAALREAVATGAELYLVIDLGGTKAYVSLMTRDATRLYDKRHATESSADPEGLVRFIEHCVREPLARIGELTGLATDDVHSKVTAIGIAFPGPTDFERGLVLDAPNLRVDDPIPLAVRMEQTFSIRTFVDNDVNLAALGEMWKGAARGHSNVVGIMIGTGIGGGLIIDGEIYRGRNKTAGEIGHLVVALESNVQCGCKQFGCLEALASRRSMARDLHNRKRELGVTDRKWLERNLLSNQIAHHFLHGDPDTVAVVTKAGEICGKAVFSILNLLNPDIVVFNGGFVQQLGARFIEPVLLEAKKCMRAVYSLDDKPIPIVVGKLPNPVLVGACRMALDASHGKVAHTRQDVFHMLRRSLGDREVLLLRDVYETSYGIAPTDNPKSDFHEEHLKKLRNLGLIFTDGPSFRRSSKVMVSPLGRMLVEETFASESSGPDPGDPVQTD